MNTTEETAAGLDAARMSKVQKLAALLIILGPESASQIVRNLEDSEIEAVSLEMTRIPLIPQPVQLEILREFSEIAIHASTGARGGPDYAQAVVEKAMGMKASNILSRVVPPRASVPVIDQFAGLDARQIFNLVKDEQAQTVALVMSYLNSDKASDVLAFMAADRREPVIERLATLGPSPVEVVEKIIQVLLHKLGTQHTRALSQTGGIKSAANLLNALDRNMSNSLLGSLEEHNPELGQSIRQKMFTFDDVGMLEAMALQKVMREVDMNDLALGLKNSPPEMQNKLLSCISKRAAETVREEITFMASAKPKDVEAAQLRIIDVVRRLETQGEIDLTEIRSKARHEAMA